MPKHQYYIGVAKAIALGSKCKKKKVGAVIVDQLGRIVSTGYNGSPINSTCECEDREDVTFVTTLHAELNAILFTSKDIQGCSLYCTLSPCLHCAACIVQKGITKVYYLEVYRDDRGIQFLEDHGVKTFKL